VATDAPSAAPAPSAHALLPLILPSLLVGAVASVVRKTIKINKQMERKLI